MQSRQCCGVMLHVASTPPSTAIATQQVVKLLVTNATRNRWWTSPLALLWSLHSSSLQPTCFCKFLTWQQMRIPRRILIVAIRRVRVNVMWTQVICSSTVPPAVKRCVLIDTRTVDKMRRMQIQCSGYGSELCAQLSNWKGKIYLIFWLVGQGYWRQRSGGRMVDSFHHAVNGTSNCYSQWVMSGNGQQHWGSKRNNQMVAGAAQVSGVRLNGDAWGLGWGEVTVGGCCGGHVSSCINCHSKLATGEKMV